MRLPGLQGALFADLGRAWSAEFTSRGYLGAYGLGLRMSLGFPLDSRGRRFVDFWFGFNY